MDEFEFFSIHLLKPNNNNNNNNTRRIAMNNSQQRTLYHGFQIRTVQRTDKRKSSRFLRLDRDSTEVEP